MEKNIKKFAKKQLRYNGVAAVLINFVSMFFLEGIVYRAFVVGVVSVFVIIAYGSTNLLIKKLED